jgi:hypothetical protein
VAAPAAEPRHPATVSPGRDSLKDGHEPGETK